MARMVIVVSLYNFLQNSVLRTLILVTTSTLALTACAAMPEYPIDGSSAEKPPAVQGRDTDSDLKATQGGNAVFKESAPPSNQGIDKSAPSSQVRPANAPVKTPIKTEPLPNLVETPPSARVTVKSGETIYDVASHYHAPVRQIIEQNNLSPPYSLYEGQVLIVPRPATYKVREGDTLFGLSRRFIVDVHSLAALNGLNLQSHLRIDQVLFLPTGARDTGAVPNTVAEIPAKVPTPPPPPIAPKNAAPLHSFSTAVAPPPVAPPRPVFTESDDKTNPPSSCEVDSSQARARRRSAHTVEDAYKAVTKSPTAVAESTDFQPDKSVDLSPTPQTPFDQAAVASGSGHFSWPLKGTVVSGFGVKPSMLKNDGIDIGAMPNTAVLASADGHVVFSGVVSGQGKTLFLEHYDDAWASIYGQLSRVLVRNQEKVKKGQVIACSGLGSAIGQPRLHFELRFRSAIGEKHKPINPLLLLPKP